jgi:hypothetical protein
LVGGGTIWQGSPSNAHRLNATRALGWRKLGVSLGPGCGAMGISACTTLYPARAQPLR